MAFTGQKRDDKVYHHYSGYIGGIKERSARSILEGKFPERIVEKAVERMLPRGPLGPQAARQPPGSTRARTILTPRSQPIVLDVAKLNPKNSRSA